VDSCSKLNSWCEQYTYISNMGRNLVSNWFMFRLGFLRSVSSGFNYMEIMFLEEFTDTFIVACVMVNELTP
jgi:hypothetical protein